MATYRQVSTALPLESILFRPVLSPRRKTLTIQAGHTYSYTASWSGQNVVFAKNQGQSVPVY